MPVASFDHASIPIGDPDAMIEFYRRLGFGIVGEQEWRSGESPIFAFTFGDSKINCHGPELWQRDSFTLRGPTAMPGCGDFCFVWKGGSEALEQMLATADAPIEAGPVEREGGRGGGRTIGTSTYTRDPDGNLLEFIIYPE